MTWVLLNKQLKVIIFVFILFFQLLPLPDGNSVSPLRSSFCLSFLLVRVCEYLLVLCMEMHVYVCVNACAVLV